MHRYKDLATYFQNRSQSMSLVYQVVQRTAQQRATPMGPGVAFANEICRDISAFPRDTVCKALNRLVKDGVLVKPFRGAYRCHDDAA